MIPNLVTEWMEYGDLYDYMKTFPRASEETIGLLARIASGLEYLHSKKVIHADLKSQNILISRDKNPLICDFGISRLIQTCTSTTETSLRGTTRWMSKELLFAFESSDPKHDEMSDMWAFGMIIYELLSWKVPYSEYNGVFVALAIIQGKLPTKPEEPEDPLIFNILWNLSLSCWKEIGIRYSASNTVASLDCIDNSRRAGWSEASGCMVLSLDWSKRNTTTDTMGVTS